MIISESLNISSYRQIRKHWQDILLVSAIAVLVGLASYKGAELINPNIFLDKQTTDSWFQSDTTRVFADMTEYGIMHHRTDVHPLFVILITPVVHVVKAAFSLNAVTAVRIVIATVTALNFSLLFILLRLIGCRLLDTTLFLLLAVISAATLFWVVIPETYPFGLLSILLALVFVVLAQNQKFSPVWYMLVNTLTLSFTVTNWMVGILATIVNHSWRQSLQVILKGFCLLAVLVIGQKIILPTTSARFLVPVLAVRDEIVDLGVLVPRSGGPLIVIKCFIFDTIVMPAIQLFDNIHPPYWSCMSVQMSSPGSASVWGSIAVILWIALLSLGVWGFFSIRKHLQLRIVLGFTILGQLALHIMYGDETFLYTLHFLPLLLVLVALSTLTRARVLALVLIGALIVSAGINNSQQFSQAVAFSHSQGPLCARTDAKCAVNGNIVSTPKVVKPNL